MIEIEHVDWPHQLYQPSRSLSNRRCIPIVRFEAQRAIARQNSLCRPGMGISVIGVAAVLRTERPATRDSRSGQGTDHGKKYVGIFLGNVDYGLQTARLILWSYCDSIFRVRDMRGSRPTGRELFFPSVSTGNSPSLRAQRARWNAAQSPEMNQCVIMVRIWYTPGRFALFMLCAKPDQIFTALASHVQIHSESRTCAPATLDADLLPLSCGLSAQRRNRGRSRPWHRAIGCCTV